MALGFSNTGTSSGGGDFLPIVKYDARAGRFFRVDREDGVSTPVDITRSFKAVFDFENVETGWIASSRDLLPTSRCPRWGRPAWSAPVGTTRKGSA